MHQSGRILHQVERNRAYARNVRSDRASQSINHTMITRPSSSGGVSSGWGVGGSDGQQRPDSAMSLCEIGVPLKISEPNDQGEHPNRNIINFPTDGSQLDQQQQVSSNAPTRVVSASSTTSSAPPHIGSRRPPSPYRRMTTPASMISDDNNNINNVDSRSAAKDEELSAQRRTISQLYHRLSTLENHIQQIQIQKRVLVAQNRRYRAKHVAATASLGFASGDRGGTPPALTETSAGAEGDDADAGAAELMLLRTTTGSPVIMNGQSGDFKSYDEADGGGQGVWDVGDTNNGEHLMAAPNQLEGDDDIGETADAADTPALSRENIASMKYAAESTLYTAARPASAGQASLLDLSERQSCASAQQAAGEQLEKERKLVEQCLGEQASNTFAFAVEVRCEEDLKDLLLLACSKLRQVQQRSSSRPSSPLPLGNASSSHTASGAAGSSTTAAPTNQQPQKVAFDVEPSCLEDSQHQWTMSVSQQRHTHRSMSSVSMKEMLDELKNAVTLWKDAAGTRLDSGLQLSLTLMQQLRVWASSCESLVERVERTKDLVLGHSGVHPSDSPSSSLPPPPLTISNLGHELDELLTVILQLSRHTTVAVDVVEKNYVQLQTTVAKCHDGTTEEMDDVNGRRSISACDDGTTATQKRGMSLSGSLRGSAKYSRSGSIWAAAASSSTEGEGRGGRRKSVLPSDGNNLAASAEQRVLKDIHRSVAQLRQDISSLQNNCKAQLQRTLKDSATDEDLLCVYRREIADAAARCNRPPSEKVTAAAGSPRSASGGRRRHPPPALGEIAADDFITVPTTPVISSSSPVPMPQPTSRPGSGAATRPRSTPGRAAGAATTSRSGSPLAAFPPPPPVVAIVPPIVAQLIKCVNSTHIAYLELFFGPVRNHSSYRSLVEQEKHAQLHLRRKADLDAAVASVDGGPAVVGSLSSMDSVVFVRRGANTPQHPPPRDTNNSQDEGGDPAIGEALARHMSVLPGTYGALIARNIAELRAFPTALSEQDEQDLTNHADIVQQLLEIGFMWSDALSAVDSSRGAADHPHSSHLRVHHCTDFLELVRRSRPMVSAFFFHNATLQATSVTELAENSASCFADAIRGLLGRGGKKGTSAHAAQHIVTCARLLQDSSRARAALNWKGLLTLHKHARMKQLLLQGLRTISASGAGGSDRGPNRGLTVEQNEQLAGNLRRLVAAFYTDLGIKFEAEQRLLKSSLRITMEAVWADFISLLRDSGDLCLATGVNIEVLDVLGPSYHTLMTEGLKYLPVASNYAAGNSPLAGATVAVPRALLSRVTSAPLPRTGGGGGGLPTGAQPQQALLAKPLDTTVSTIGDADASAVAGYSESVIHDDVSSPWAVLFPPRTGSASGLAACSTTSLDVGAAPMWLGLCISKSVDTQRTFAQQLPGTTRQTGAVNRLPPGCIDGRLRPLRPQPVAQSAYHAQQAARNASPHRSGHLDTPTQMFKLAPSQQSVVDVGRKMYTTSAVLSKENPWISRKR
jgi:hypothetical protein